MKKIVDAAKHLILIAVFLSLFPFALYGNDSPFTVNARVLKDKIPVGGLVPVSVTFTIAPQHHIYKDQVRIEANVDTSSLKVASVEYPPGTIKNDPFLGKDVEFYKGHVEIKTFLRLSEDVPAGPFEIKLIVRYQGCSETVCFAPTKKNIVLPLNLVNPDQEAMTPPEEVNVPPSVSEPEEITDENDFGKGIESRGIFLTFILIFFAGVGISFTPCVYPMIPITVAVIGGQATRDQASEKKTITAFFLSLIYVLGISIVYSAMGVTAASTGALFGSALQSPWVIGFFVVVFVGLAMSMFGVYYLRVPSFISDRLGAKQGKGFLGVFVMGLVSGVVASPCIGPILASLLVYIASTGNKFLGFWMLFIFAWGQGVLLIVLGTFSGAVKALPKTGTWMRTVERVFGLLLIGAALYYLRIIISESVFVIILGLFLIVTAIFSGGFDRLTQESTTFQRTKKSFGIVAFIFGVYFLGGNLLYKGFILPPLPTASSSHMITDDKEINWVFSEEAGLKKAHAEDKTAIIDFWASWCSACLEFDQITYADPEVIKETKRFVNIKIDSTNTNDPKVKQLWKKYEVVGLPTIVFVKPDGTVIKEKTITGFTGPEKYLEILKSLP